MPDLKSKSPKTKNTASVEPEVPETVGPEGDNEEAATIDKGAPDYDLDKSSSFSDDIREEVARITEELNDDNPNKTEEYFETKRVIKTLRRDLKDIKEQHPDYEESEKIKKQLKTLRDRINSQEELKILADKIANLKERMDLLKEIIKMELLQSERKEIKHEGRKLKIVPTLKEMKDSEDTD